MLNTQALIQKRDQIERLRKNTSLSTQQAYQLGQSILSSWQRSESAAIPADRKAAPLSQVKSAHTSALNQAVLLCKEDLKNIAQQSSMVIAVGDVGSTIIWSASSGQMQREAERVHFIEGGQ